VIHITFADPPPVVGVRDAFVAFIGYLMLSG
jgi:hypothetical protein